MSHYLSANLASQNVVKFPLKLGWNVVRSVGWVELQGVELGEVRRGGIHDGEESCVMGWGGMRSVVCRLFFLIVFAAGAAKYPVFFSSPR